MAIAPNTTFTSGQIYTAVMANAYPFGTMQYASSTTALALITTITTTFTLPNFTAIANRNYKITYFEPNMFCTIGTGETIMTFKNGASTIATTSASVSSTVSSQGNFVFITTFTAGVISLTASLTYAGSGTLTSSRSATRTAFMLVEDIGPA